MDTNDTEHQKRDQESNNTGLGETENNKHPGGEGQQHTVRNKLKEDLQITWQKVRLLQMSETERLPTERKQQTDSAQGRNKWNN